MLLKSILKSVIKRLPFINELVKERDSLIKASGFVPPGHFYSPIPSIDEVNRDEERIFAKPDKQISGIELRETEQLSLLQSFEKYYADIPFKSEKTKGSRYYFENPAYSYCDAIFLNFMIRYAQPKRIVEIGSGFSSCATLDTNEIFFNNSISTTFIEPYPDLLLSLISEEDKERIKILPTRLQDVPLSIFSDLESGDILFIDSTHVGKVFSDVNLIFFEILPRLQSGVYIHIHDVFFPFEYPKEWIFGGRAWNEIYMLRCFLQYNQKFEIILMNTYLEHFHEAYFRERMPLCLKNRGGSIWLRKN